MLLAPAGESEPSVRLERTICRASESRATDRLPQQNLVESPVLRVQGGPLEEDLRRQPPVGDEDLLSGGLHRVGHVPHVVAAVHVPARAARAVAHRRK